MPFARRCSAVVAVWVLHPQHLPALRLVSRDRVVARDLAVMGIVAAVRPLDLLARGHQGSIDVDRQAAQAGVADRPRHDECVHPLQPRQMPGTERGEPPADGPRRREPAQPAQPEHEGIAGQVAQVAPPAPPTDHERQQHEDHRRHAEVAPRQPAAELAPQQRHHTEQVEVPARELESPVRRELPLREAQRQIPVDPPPQIRFSPPHWEWPFAVGEFVGSTPRIYHTGGPSHSLGVMRSLDFLSHRG